MRYSPIPSQLFTDRRKQFARRMKPGSLAIFYSNDLMPRSGDQFYPFRQDPALFALTGLDQPGSILVLFPTAKKKSDREIVFILPADPKHAIWNGDRLTPKQAKHISGISAIYTTEHWNQKMPLLFRTVDLIYVSTREQDRFTTTVLSQNDRMAMEIKSIYPHLSFLSARMILQQIMMIKHPMEIELIKKAIEVTGLAFDRILKTVKPGMKEYEVEAELTYMLSRHGCQHAFEPIVASGSSACTLHYVRNDQTISPDALILIDFGAEYASMASDMTRTIPASGKFSKEQKKFYNAVLHVLNEVTTMMRPGIVLDHLNKEAGKLIESELVNLKILRKQEIKRQDPKSPLWKKYFMHGISHHLGYDVHDISDKEAVLRSGMVLTCEPGLYVPELRIGIRLENDILITRSGPKNLMKSIPIAPEEIETIMHS